MIVKGRARGRSRQLAAHLQRRDQNETVRLYELRGVTASDLDSALAEMESLTAAVASKRPLYHASISPEAHRPLTDDQVRIAADTLERKLGLTGQPRAIVLHRKAGRDHVHVVWSRIYLERQRLISDARNYRAHEEAARELETAFGHRAVAGAHVPAPQARKTRACEDYEYRQAERARSSPETISAELTQLWQAAGDAETFRRKLEAAGYMLARGDRRAFVVLDRNGNAHALARRLGMPTATLRARLGREAEALPSVAEARGVVGRRNDCHPMAVRFRAAAAETALARDRIGRRAARPALPRPTGARPASARPGIVESLFRSAVGWINLGQHERRGIARVRTARLATASRLGALRAAILADFARKMDAAAAQLSDAELLAALARLTDEREAALKTSIVSKGGIATGP